MPEETSPSLADLIKKPLPPELRHVAFPELVEAYRSIDAATCRVEAAIKLGEWGEQSKTVHAQAIRFLVRASGSLIELEILAASTERDFCLP